MILEILTQKEFYEQMKAYFVANQSRITDLNVGSTIDTQLNAFATQLNQVMIKSSGGFKAQFEQIPFQIFDFPRKEESKASGTVIFSRAVADPVQIDIPVGTIVGTVSGLLFTTQGEVSILSGASDSSAANIIANEAGTDYNSFIGDISVLNSSVPGINSVSNNIPTAGGADLESNSLYFTRFTNYILGLAGSNRYGIITAATGVDTIQSGYVEDHFPPESGIYNFTVYVDDGSGSVPSAKLEEIELVIYGDGTSAYPGYAAAGINFRALSAGLVTVNVVYSAEIDAVSYDPDTIEAEIAVVITNYINSLWVGSSVIRAELIKLIQGLSGVVNTTVLTLNGAASDITILASQVPRVGTITATIS